MKRQIKCGLLFAGMDESVIENVSIYVDGSLIAGVAREMLPGFETAEVIDLSDKFVMPGLIDGHTHVCLKAGPSVDYLQTMLPGDILIDAMENAKADLLAGFTTIRDLCGMHYVDVSLKKAIAQKRVPGPRMLVAGTSITAVGGHGDGHMAPHVEGAAMGTIVNGPDEARRAARTNFKYGADVVKVFATGGVMSFGDEPGAAELTYEEMKAAIDVAKVKGRTSSAHAHGAAGIKEAIRAGITSIEHGMLIDDEAMELMLEHGTYLVPTIIAAYQIVEMGKEGGLPDWMVAKAAQCLENHGSNVAKMLKMGVKIGFGTDVGTSFNPHGKQGFEFELMTRYGFTPAQALLAATKVNAEMINMQDKLGSLEAGKYADIIAFNGNPLEDIRIMKDCAFVMKDGDIYKQ